MKRQIGLWQLVGFAVTSLIGTLLHFLYELTDGSMLAAPFSGVNESTWEHMKLLFFPMLLFSAVQFAAAGQNYPNFLAVRAVSILAGTLLIPVLFYTYTGVLGHDVTWVNVSIFYVVALAVFLLDSCLLRQGVLFGPWKQLLGLAVLWLAAFCLSGVPGSRWSCPSGRTRSPADMGSCYKSALRGAFSVCGVHNEFTTENLDHGLLREV